MIFNWFLALPLLTQIFFVTGVISSLILLIQTVLSLIGADFEGGDFSGDLDLPGEMPEGFGDLQIFSLRTILAFFTTFGWIGFSMMQSGAHLAVAIAVAVLAGAVIMLGVAFLIRGVLRLQYDGTRQIENALGAAGTVYLRIPGKRTGRGKVNLLLQGAYVELDALTDSEEALPYGTEITVTAVVGEDAVVVAPAGVSADSPSENQI